MFLILCAVISTALVSTGIAQAAMYPRLDIHTGAAWNSNLNAAFKGDTAYVAAALGLLVLDLTDPEHPIELDRQVVQGGCSGLAIYGDYLYVGALRQGLGIFDISTPVRPRLISLQNCAGLQGMPLEAYDLAVSVEYRKLVISANCFWGGCWVWIYDLTDPLVPRFEKIGYGSYALEILGHVLLSKWIDDTGGEGISATNLATPAIPTDLGELYRNSQVGDRIRNCDAADGFLYTARDDHWVRLFAIRDPVLKLGELSRLVERSHLRLAHDVRSVAAAGRRAYVAGENLMSMIDFGNLGQPELVGTIPVSWPHGRLVAGPACCLSFTPFSGVSIMGARGEEPIAELFRQPERFLPQVLAHAEHHLFIGGLEPGVVSVDLRNPFVVSPWDGFEGMATTMQVAGHYAFLATSSAQLLVVDVSDPLHPVWLQTLVLPESARHSALVSNYLLLALGHSGLQCINVADPTHPGPVVSLILPDTVESVWPVGSRALIGMASGDVAVLSLSDSTLPRVTGTIRFPEGASAVLRYPFEDSQDHLVLVDAGGRLSIVASLDDSLPVVVSRQSIMSSVSAVSLESSRWLIVAEGDHIGYGNLRLLDVQDARQPIVIQTVSLPGPDGFGSVHGPMVQVDGTHYFTLLEGVLGVRVVLEDTHYLRGDANGDGSVSLADPVYVARYLFGGGAPPLPDPSSADVDCSGHVGLLDVIRLVNYTLRAGPAPGCPNY